MDPLDIIIGAIGLDSPSLGIAIGLTAEEFDLIPGIIDSPLFEAIAALAAEDFDLAQQPFEAIAVSPEFEAPEFEFVLALVWEPNIPAAAMGGGHAIPLWQLLMPEEPEVVIDESEDDDEEALIIILALAA